MVKQSKSTKEDKIKKILDRDIKIIQKQPDKRKKHEQAYLETLQLMYNYHYYDLAYIEGMKDALTYVQRLILSIE